MLNVAQCVMKSGPHWRLYAITIGVEDVDVYCLFNREYIILGEMKLCLLLLGVQ